MMPLVVSEVTAGAASASSNSFYEVRIPSEAELIEVHDGDALFSCPYPNCSIKCRRKCALALHIHKVHPASATEKRKEIVYHCPVASCRYAATHPECRFFDRLKHLKQHFAKMHLDKRYTCERCEKRFSLKGECERHERQCGEQFACDDCSAQYNARSSLFTHCLRTAHQLPARYAFFSKRSPTAARTSKLRRDVPALKPASMQAPVPKIRLARERPTSSEKRDATLNSGTTGSVLLLVPVTAVQNAIDTILATPTAQNCSGIGADKMASSQVNFTRLGDMTTFRPICSAPAKLRVVEVGTATQNDAAKMCESNTQTYEQYVSVRQPRVVHDIAVSTQPRANACDAIRKRPAVPVPPRPVTQTERERQLTANCASQTNDSDELDAIIASLVRSCETQTHSSYIQNQQFFATATLLCQPEEASIPVSATVGPDLSTLFDDDAPTKLRCSIIQTETDSFAFECRSEPQSHFDAVARFDQAIESVSNAHAGVQTVDSAFEQDFASSATQTCTATCTQTTAFDQDDDEELMRCWFTQSAEQQLAALATLDTPQSQPETAALATARYVRESEAQTTLQRGTRDRQLVTPPIPLDRCFGVLESSNETQAQAQAQAALVGGMTLTSVGATQTLFEYFDLLDTATQTEKF